MPLEIEKSFTIKKATLPDKEDDEEGVSLTMASWTYGQEASEPVLTGNKEGAYVGYTYKLKGEPDMSYTTRVPSAAGDYVVCATIAETANYEAKSVTAEFSIAARQARLAWSDTSFVYDGTSHAPTCQIENALRGDDVYISVTGGQTKVGSYSAQAVLAGTQAANYTLPDEVTCAFSITLGTLTPTLSMKNWTYGDAASSPKLTGNTESAPVTYSYKLKGADDSAYTQTTPRVAGDYVIRAEIAASENYADCVVTAEFSIEQKIASLIWSGTSLVYTAQPQAPQASLANLVEGDVCEVVVSGAQTDAGEYSARAVGLSNANYKLSDAVNQTFIIARADLALSVEIDSWAYGTEAEMPVVSGVPEGLNEKIEYKPYGSRDTAYTEEVPTQAGTYTLRACLAQTQNYKAGAAETDFMVIPRMIELAWQNTSFVYDGNEHVPSVSVANLVEGDECRLTVRGASVNVGVYRASAVDPTNPNYQLGFGAYTSFEITRADVSPTVTINNWEYGNSPASPYLSLIPTPPLKLLISIKA